MNKRKAHEEQIVSSLCEVINHANLNPTELVSVVATFLFSVGASVAECGALQSSEEVLMNYAKNPTLGNALMAQALHMKETWITSKEQKGEEEDVTTTDAVQDL